MSKNTFLALLGASIALWLGGILGLICYALTAIVIALAGIAYDAARFFAKGLREGLAQQVKRPQGQRPHLYVVK